MPKARLDQTYVYKGKYYGPGEVDFPEVPEAEQAGLSQALKDALAGKAPAKSQETPQRRGSEDDLSELTVAELKDRARDAEIEGFSTMNKAELVKALSK